MNNKAGNAIEKILPKGTKKRAYAKIWAKRQSQIEGVIGSLSHVVGDLQGNWRSDFCRT